MTANWPPLIKKYYSCCFRAIERSSYCHGGVSWLNKVKKAKPSIYLRCEVPIENELIVIILS
jgi:hypothetical protein